MKQEDSMDREQIQSKGKGRAGRKVRAGDEQGERIEQ
jgi:hypothetical protein